MESDTSYFARRAAQERQAALKARHPGARQAHLDIAARYDDLIAALVAHEQVTAARAEPSLRLVSSAAK
jgi:hypothetical protein